MIRPDPAITALPWQKLIEEIGHILYKDSNTLERNINYYLKIHKLPETDPVKLQNLYNKLQREKNRFHYYTEMYFRLQNPNLVNMMNGIEEVFEKQERINGHLENDFVIYYRKFEELTQVYYMPL